MHNIPPCPFLQSWMHNLFQSGVVDSVGNCEVVSSGIKPSGCINSLLDTIDGGGGGFCGGNLLMFVMGGRYPWMSSGHGEHPCNLLLYVVQYEEQMAFLFLFIGTIRATLFLPFLHPHRDPPIFKNDKRVSLVF